MFQDRRLEFQDQTLVLTDNRLLLARKDRKKLLKSPRNNFRIDDDVLYDAKLIRTAHLCIEYSAGHIASSD